MVVVVQSAVLSCDTGDQGRAVHEAVRIALSGGGNVTVDFSGVTNVTSSFVNAAFVALLCFMSFDDVRQRMKIVNANRQVAGMIRERMRIESKRLPAAA